MNKAKPIKKMKKRRKRKQKKHILSKMLTVCGTNANGIKSKKESFLNLLHTDNPQVFMLQETKLSRKNQFPVKGYEIFEKVRKNKGGGGIMIGIKNEVQATPVDVSPQDPEIEILVVEVELKEVTIRFLTAYGPQEDDSEDKINKFYCTLEEEIIKCEERKCGLIVEMDCNAKLGKTIIQGDPHEMSSNGKLLWDIIQRRDCCVVNATEKCEGTITRSRIKGGTKEESVIDFVIINPQMIPYIEAMEIDESKTKALTRFKKGIPVPSDHNHIKCSFNIPLVKRHKARQEIYCLRNEASLKKFKEVTTSTKKFSSCFTKDGDIRKEGKKWLKLVRRTIHVCFRKVRITERKKDQVQEQLDERRMIKSKVNQANTAAERHELEDRLQRIEQSISDSCETKHINIIRDQIRSITNKDGTTNNTGVWKLRRKIFPRPAEQLSGKKDKEGNLVTNPDKLKEVYLDAYVERLKHRKMIPELLRLKTLREELFQQRLKRAKQNKSPDWTVEELDKVLHHLKRNKAMDPTGLVNELFMPQNIGKDLKDSILLMMNKIKRDFQHPEFMSMANVTSLWKRKGAKDDIDNERGIFILNILRMIKDRLIQNDVKKVVDMSDSQVGSREEYSHRNHLFILYSCINSAIQKESPPIDIHMYDLSKCFDGLWLEECCNNLYEAGVVDDKLALIYEGNCMNQVAIRTPAGLSNRETIERIVTQGGVTGPMCCAVQTDRMGKDALRNNKFLYMYKGEVGIPTLAMVDDIAKISECGTPSVIDNTYVNARIEQTKQQFNRSKCHAMHAGKQSRPCDALKAHNMEMEVVTQEKYVGDIITNNGKCTKNIMARRSKGVGVISEITNILDGLCLGVHYFTTALMLRQVMLHQVLLSNSETWGRLIQKDIERLERVDCMLLQKLFQVPSSTPTASLYLETGCIPIRLVMKMKRVMYLYHILTREEDALITRAFWAQVRKPAKGDWCTVVREDLESIGLSHLSYEKISNMKEETLRTLLKDKIRETAFHKLQEEKQKNSKMIALRYTNLSLQPYLSTESRLSNNEKRALFRWRTHMIKVKQNYGVKDAMCPLCKKESDSQYHLLTCPELINKNQGGVRTIRRVMNALRLREVVLERNKTKCAQPNRDNVKYSVVPLMSSECKK